MTPRPSERQNAAAARDFADMRLGHGPLTQARSLSGKRSGRRPLNGDSSSGWTKTGPRGRQIPKWAQTRFQPGRLILSNGRSVWQSELRTNTPAGWRRTALLSFTLLIFGGMSRGFCSALFCFLLPRKKDKTLRRNNSFPY